MDIRKQLAKWYSLEFLGNFSIYEGVSILFLLSRGFTLLDFGIAEGFFHVSSLLFEIPSGMLADILGRKKILFLSQLTFVLSALIMIFSKTLLWIILSYSAAALGYALLSGAREAICYDSLAECGRKSDYLKVAGNGEVCYQFSRIIGNLCSGIALRLGYILSYGIRAATSFFSAGIALCLQEPAVSKARIQKFSFAMLGQNMKDQFIKSAQFLRHMPGVARIMLSAAVAACARVLISFYIQDLLAINGANGFTIGLYLVIISFGSILGAKTATLFERRYTFPLRIFLCALGAAAGVILAGTVKNLAAIAAGCFICFHFETVIALNASAALNHRISSDKRATLVSASSMLFSVFMLPASPLSGWIADRQGMGTAFLSLSGLFVLLAAGAAVYIYSGKQKRMRG